MNWIIDLFDLRGLKAWMLVLGFGLDLLFSFLFFSSLANWLNQRGGWRSGTDLALMLGVFLICGLVALGVTLLARDGSGTRYGLISAFGAFFLVLVLFSQSVFLALIIGLTGLLGGYNGGMLGERIIESQRD